MWNQLNHHYENNYYEINLTNEMTKNLKKCENIILVSLLWPNSIVLVSYRSRA
jgi:hypothetical protein